MDRKRLSICRPSTGACDPAEQCDGASDDCPADVQSPDGTTCEDADACTSSGTCAQGQCRANGPASCDDADACTTDTCEAMVGCTHTPLQGFAALTCRCEGGLAARSCTAQSVPLGVGKQFARACNLIARANGLKPAKARKLMAKAAKSLKLAGKIAAQAKKRRAISADCASALSGKLSDLKVHTQSVRGG
jgi:hypothetical protein